MCQAGSVLSTEGIVNKVGHSHGGVGGAGPQTSI